MTLNLINQSAINLTASTALETAAPVSRQNGNGEAAAPASTFAALLNPGTLNTVLQDEHLIAEDNPLLPVIEDTPGIAPSTDAAAAEDDTAEDAAWPPEGLASLWLPAAEPQPAPAPVAIRTPASSAVIAPGPMDIDPMDTGAINTSPGSILPSSGTDTPETASNAQGAPSFSIPQTPPDGNALPAEPEQAAQETDPFPPPSKPQSDPIFLGEKMEGTPAQAPSRSEIPAFASITTAASIAPAPPPLPQPIPSAPFPAPDLNADNFSDTLGPHIQWLAEHKIGHARIQLNPEDMGPVDVRLKLDGDQLQADFMSARPEVRQTLEHALPRLRELLGEHGLTLAQADIGQQPSRQHSAPTARTDDPASADSDHIDADAAPTPSAPVPLARSSLLIDAYA